MKLKYLIPIFMIGLPLFTLGCGEDPEDPPPDINKKIRVDDNEPGTWLNSYLAEADGVTYRCFDTGPRGGLWCTQQFGSEVRY